LPDGELRRLRRSPKAPIANGWAAWMAPDLFKLNLLVIQIDGLHIGNDLVLVADVGIHGEGHKDPLALIEGATENAATVQASAQCS
jgi:hypothetical protein